MQVTHRLEKQEETAEVTRSWRSVLAVAILVVLAPVRAQAQVRGFRIEVGPVFLTKTGSFTFGPSEIESDAGFAFRGKLRYGFGALSLAADFQASAQDYGHPPDPGAPDNLNAAFLGATAALHPFKIAGIAPYAEIGIGKLFFGDEKISTKGGLRASSYGLGVVLGGEGRVALDVGLRLMRETGLSAEGVVGEFKYDPKLFSVLLSIRL
jgi:hypothetical protein